MSERGDITRSASRWERLTDPSRLAGIDLARGLAVLGMFAAHLYAVPGFVWTDASTWGGIVSGRSSILFATLAGVSLGLVTGRSTPYEGERLGTARRRIVVRAALLWVIGILLIATGVPVYVILPAYAILFLLALPFLQLRARPLFLIAVGVALVMPWVQAWIDSFDFWSTPGGGDVGLLLGINYPFPVWIAFVLAGLGAARSGLRRLSTQVALVCGGAALAVVGYGLDWLAPAVPDASLWAAVWTAEPHSSGLLEVVGSGGFALAAIGASLLLCRTVVSWVVLPLRAVGSMPLTAYVGQLVAWAIAASVLLDRVGDLTGFRALDPFGLFAVTAVVGCTAWALLVGRGPLEWAIDAIARRAVPGRPRSGAADPRR
ncbi:heparan-alpha-glucosaminide N-acetyltransferase domain-containing protein [Microbacterium sp. RU33B]|uniref:heparan-alpha-glucosaminide N-acetyltransferase domain-containing protein n=1 Tax=Microbacterium sp. RU33B TaxID=1907390 RepID=UPI002116B180|nr:heparan-alpha-glucosaminide N-acetyltransferase domain-containing protein [Microbacterium sp. RU33B]